MEYTLPKEYQDCNDSMTLIQETVNNCFTYEEGIWIGSVLQVKLKVDLERVARTNTTFNEAMQKLQTQLEGKSMVPRLCLQIIDAFIYLAECLLAKLLQKKRQYVSHKTQQNVNVIKDILIVKQWYMISCQQNKTGPPLSPNELCLTSLTKCNINSYFKIQQEYQKEKEFDDLAREAAEELERQEYEEREAEIQRKWFETIKKEREEAEKRRQEEEEKKYVDDTLSGKNKPHQVLRVAKDATQDEIRTSFRKLAIKWHPDKNLNNQEVATKMMQKINQAYGELFTNKRTKETENKNNKRKNH